MVSFIVWLKWLEKAEESGIMNLLAKKEGIVYE